MTPKWTYESATIDRVVAVTNECTREAERCVETGLYRPACVLMGAGLEGALLSTAMLAEPSLKEDGLWPSRRGVDRDALELHLGELVDLAIAAKWIPADYRGLKLKLDDGDLGNAVDWLKWLRNLVHPGAFVREMGGDELGRVAFENASGVLGKVYEELTAVLDRVGKDLATRQV
jgi:hypothetical protein